MVISSKENQCKEELGKEQRTETNTIWIEETIIKERSLDCRVDNVKDCKTTGSKRRAHYERQEDIVT